MKVLDKGFIEVIDKMGDDTTVVNAARVSHAKSISEMSDRDEKLIKFLTDNSHVSPFYHPHVMFRVKAPISVQRQWYKHKIGTAENSESSRYVEMHEEFYVPEVFRLQSSKNKQGSDGFLDKYTERAAQLIYQESLKNSYETYKALIASEVTREQAREVLPLCTYTSWVWTASLQAIAHFIKLRDESHAQWEIQQYAKAMRTLTEPYFPISLKALLGERNAS